MSKLTEKQEKKTLTSIARLVRGYQKKENVECIYFTPYEKNGQIYFDLTIVFDKIDKKSLKNIREYNKKHAREEVKEKCGGQIIICPDLEKYYSAIAMELGEIRRVRDLLSSHIFYDKTGRYNFIAHQFDRYNTIDKYNNLIDMNIPDKIKVKTKTKKED